MGLYTAALVENLYVSPGGAEPGAVASSSKQALKQLTDYLQQCVKRHRPLPRSELSEVHKDIYRVYVLPEQVVGGRSYPGTRRVRLEFECVRGRVNGDLWLASSPRFDIRFFFYEGDDLRSRLNHEVQVALRGLDPAGVAHYLPPASTHLSAVEVRVPRKVREAPPAPFRPETLMQTCEPLHRPVVRRSFGPAWERDVEARELVEKLGLGRGNVMLVGEGGAGKTTLLADAVRRLLVGSDESPQFWLTSGSRLISGMKYLGQWQRRCDHIVSELRRVRGVLCVENLLELVRQGGEGPEDGLAAYFAPYMRAGELRVIAEATPAELDACRRLLPGLVELFKIQRLQPFDRHRSLSVLGQIVDQQRQNQSIRAEKGTIDVVEGIHRRFMPYAAMPGAGARFLLDLFDRAAAEGRAEVNGAMAVERFVQRTGLPEVFVRDDLTLSSDEVFDTLRRDVLGQDGPCRLVADVATTFKAGLNDPGRPIGVLLLCGPTGVGKTQLARSLSRYCFGHGEDEAERIVRVDMSEYATSGSASRLLTDGRGNPSRFIEQVRQQPFTVVLFDEVEKAADEVFDVLLDLLDEGRIIDAYGRETRFRSAFIVLTSNIGARSSALAGFDDGPPTHYDREVREFFRPEFYNRLDDVLIFDPLSRGTIRAITAKELSDLRRREGLAERGFSLSWSDDVVEHLVNEGFDEAYGARNLQRAVEAHVVVTLARYLLENEVEEGTDLRLEMGEEGVVVVVHE